MDFSLTFLISYVDPGMHGLAQMIDNVLYLKPWSKGCEGATSHRLCDAMEQSFCALTLMLHQLSELTSSP